MNTGWSLQNSPNGTEYVHPDFGELHIGVRPDGNIGWTFHEKRGGGQVIVPFTFIGRTLFIGLLREVRQLQGGVVFNVPRGFSNGGTPEEDAIQEEGEEVGFLYTKSRIYKLPGEYGNPNSSFFVTEDSEGVMFYAYRLLEQEMEEVREAWWIKPVYQIKRNLLLPTSEDNIQGLRFLHWTVAARAGDMFSNAAVARLLASFE